MGRPERTQAGALPVLPIAILGQAANQQGETEMSEPELLVKTLAMVDEALARKPDAAVERSQCGPDATTSGGALAQFAEARKLAVLAD